MNLHQGLLDLVDSVSVVFSLTWASPLVADLKNCIKDNDYLLVGNPAMQASFSLIDWPIVLLLRCFSLRSHELEWQAGPQR